MGGGCAATNLGLCKYQDSASGALLAFSRLGTHLPGHIEGFRSLEYFEIFRNSRIHVSCWSYISRELY